MALPPLIEADTQKEPKTLCGVHWMFQNLQLLLSHQYASKLMSLGIWVCYPTG